MKKEKILRLAENKRIVTIQRARFHTGQVRERALYFGEYKDICSVALNTEIRYLFRTGPSIYC